MELRFPTEYISCGWQDHTSPTGDPPVYNTLRRVYESCCLPSRWTINLEDRSVWTNLRLNLRDPRSRESDITFQFTRSWISYLKTNNNYLNSDYSMTVPRVYLYLHYFERREKDFFTFTSCYTLGRLRESKSFRGLRKFASAKSPRSTINRSRPSKALSRAWRDFDSIPLSEKDYREPSQSIVESLESAHREHSHRANVFV